MIVEKTDILCNGRIIKYLSAHPLDGNTPSSRDEHSIKKSPGAPNEQAIECKKRPYISNKM